MVDSKSDASPPVIRREAWEWWSGSSQLLAGVGEAALRAVSEREVKPVDFRIDVEVADDHETFESPSDFVEKVTGEALRKFKTIRMEVVGREAGAVVVVQRLTTLAVKLAAVALDDEAADHVFAVVRTALNRGGSEGGTSRGRVDFGPLEEHW